MSGAFDVVVVGGGPAGLATAIAAAQHGLSAAVLERQSMPSDKACGEGLMPAAVNALERFGVRSLLDPDQCARFAGICLVQRTAHARRRCCRSPAAWVFAASRWFLH